MYVHIQTFHDSAVLQSQTAAWNVMHRILSLFQSISKLYMQLTINADLWYKAYWNDSRQ